MRKNLYNRKTVGHIAKGIDDPHRLIRDEDPLKPLFLTLRNLSPASLDSAGRADLRRLAASAISVANQSCWAADGWELKGWPRTKEGEFVKNCLQRAGLNDHRYTLTRPDGQLLYVSEPYGFGLYGAGISLKDLEYLKQLLEAGFSVSLDSRDSMHMPAHTIVVTVWRKP